MGGFIVKTLVFIINFVLWISGILLIVFGSIALASPYTIITILSVIPGVTVVVGIFNPYYVFQGMAIFMIVLGSFLFLFGGIGCHGAYRMHKRMIMNYWITLVLATLTEIALIIYGAVYPPTVNNYVQTEMLLSLTTQFQPVTINGNTVVYSDQTAAASWEMLQSQTHCCGVFGYSDYSTFSWNQTVGSYNALPPTCCSTSTSYGVNVTSTAEFTDSNGCLNNPVPATGTYWTTGCWENVINMVWQFDYIAIIISSCLMAAQLLGIILTVHTWHKMVREDGKL